MIDEKVRQRLRRLMEARVKRDGLKADLKAAEEDFRTQESEVYESLEDSDIVGTIKVDLGDPWGIISFRTRETYYGRIIDEEAALEHFERRAMVDELTAPQFVKRRVNEIVRDCIEQGIEMPPGIDYYPQRGVTVTRQKD